MRLPAIEAVRERAAAAVEWLAAASAAVGAAASSRDELAALVKAAKPLLKVEEGKARLETEALSLKREILPSLRSPPHGRTLADGFR